MRFADLTIRARILGMLLLLSLIAVGGTAVTYFYLQSQSVQIAAMLRSSRSVAEVERMRAGIFAVVMENRGLYMTRDRQETQQYADSTRRYLVDIQTAWDRLRPRLAPSQAALSGELSAALREFTAQRTEIARIAVDQGNEAAERFGNNAANRANRTALDRAMADLAGTTLKLVEEREQAMREEDARESFSLVAVSLAVAMAVLLLALWTVRRHISRPLGGLTRALEDMAEGKLDDVHLPPAGKTEVGQIAAAGQVFLEKLCAARDTEAGLAAERERRDRRQEAMDRATQDFGASISGVLNALADSAANMRRASSEMSQAAETTQNSATDMAARADGAVSELGAVSAATEQLTASAGEIARQVAQATETSRAANEHAQTTDGRMGELQAAAERIGDVVRLISEIAGQTNLLALNATIEAARAGDAGKGFAVVASEVKQLAAQTARATEDISAQVQGIRGVTEQTAQAVRQMGTSIAQVDEVAAAIAAAVEQQSAATREIATSVLGVVDTTRAITDAMRDAASLAETSTTKGREVHHAADEVNRVSGTLSNEVENFLTAMRGGENERRRYERISGGDMPARLRRPGQGGEVSATIEDISRGGVSLSCSSAGLKPGMEVEVHAGGLVVLGRIARPGAMSVGIAFQQNPAMLAKADQLLATIRNHTGAERAAA